MDQTPHESSLSAALAPVEAADRLGNGTRAGSPPAPCARSEPSPATTATQATLARRSAPRAGTTRPTVDMHVASERPGRHHGPDHETEPDAIDGHES